eukprot:GILJ01014656.1.p1 GENE.GILJ01014656.1~~GILJ01014656.1.p1  ORF type:complete len:320 (+),score=26.53 GILJ01014656.1:626-1585(+)
MLSPFSRGEKLQLKNRYAKYLLPYDIHVGLVSPKQGHQADVTSTPANAKSKKRKLSPDKETTEKRLKRFVSAPTSKVFDRIVRAFQHRLYLIEKKPHSDDALERDYVVLGNTGFVYTIHIGTLPSCTCPDFAKGNLCKHILFVLLRVLKVPRNSPLVYQRAFLSSELKEIYSYGSKGRLDRTVVADEAVRKRYSEMTGSVTEDVEGVKQRPLEGEECPICFEPFTTGEAVVWCRAQCGSNLHRDCFNRWRQQKGANVTCPFCRARWRDEGTQSSDDRSHGIKNGQFLDLSDVSTEHQSASLEESYPDTYRFLMGGYRRY